MSDNVASQGHLNEKGTIFDSASRARDAFDPAKRKYYEYKKNLKKLQFYNVH